MSAPKKITLSRFDYYLPKNLIGQKPIKPRDSARLLILNKKNGKIEHKKFYNIVDYLKPGDVLVLNDSQVIPARLIGQKETGGKIEIFLLNKKFHSLLRGRGEVADNFGQPLFNLPLEREENNNVWRALIGGHVKINQAIFFPKNIKAKIIKKYNEQSWLVEFNASDKKLLSIGQTPLPPYIKKMARLADYQTVYAKSAGSVAAPTAGLHFTKQLINRLKKKGVIIEYLTLHIGLGTFQPVKSQYIQDHKIHSEWASLNKKTADNLNHAKKSGRQIVAVGTTTLRTLEAFADNHGELNPQSGWLNIFIYPGYKFRLVNKLITNFHLPKSTLLILVSAMASEKFITKAYQAAIDKKYKFFSFGDAMFIR